MNPQLLLLEAAPEALRPVVLSRLSGALQDEILGWPGSPGPALCSHIVARGTTAQRAALARNRRAAPDTVLALACLGDPAIADRVLRNEDASRDAYLAAARVVPAHYLVPPPDEPPSIYGLTKRLLLAVELDIPELTTAALAVLHTRRRLGVHAPLLVRGYLGLLRTVGPVAARDAIRPFLPLPDDISPAVRHMLTGPADLGLLEDLFERHWGTTGLIAFFSRPGRRYVDRKLLDRWPHGSLDWEVVEAAHREKPLPEGAASYLGRQVGCPEAILRHRGELLRRSAQDQAQRMAQLAEHDEELPVPRLEDMQGRPFDYDEQRTLGAAVERGELSVGEIFGRGAPAAAALLLLNQGSALREGIDAQLRDFAVGHLGDDAAAWSVAITLLEEFPGTPAELLATAAAAVRRCDRRAVADPRAGCV
ncbi:hypothetical protein [Yinghuangia soli]|uniref:Uncharacterized protein n=1 Tax=Yinghuangia soli TaxID=2908204 RepID=A0AA41PYP7_9ACTN|nr:hypothetical protein [Yinghuangia soli]MCF2528364.1 hypothetical protein [Yinghuangia soli]